MQPKRLYRWLALIFLATLALTGCAPRTGQGEAAAQPGAEEFVVDLPALVIDIDQAGTPTVGGAPLAALASAFGAAGLENLSVSPEQVQMLTDANIQHIQLNNTASGLQILVNGAAIPTLVWDAASLEAASGLVGQLGDGMPPLLQQLLPVIGRLGAGVTLRFPLAQGATLIELAPVAAEGAASAEAAQAEYLESVGTPARLSIPVTYDAAGNWSVAGMTDAEWTALTGQSFWQSLVLPAETIAALTAAGVSEIRVYTDPAGLHLAINGTDLPYLSWGEGRLNQALNLAVQTGLLDNLGDTDPEALVGAVEALLPILTTSQVEIQVTLPQ